MRPPALVLRLCVCASLAACTGPQVSATSGVLEPISVESGQLIEGTLPGIPPPASGTATGTDAGAAANPQVTDVTIPNIAIAPGARGVQLSGHTTPDAQAVGVRFADAGSGYWIVALGPPDPTDNNLPSWSFNADFSPDLSPGFHDLLFAAIGPNGQSGDQYDQPLCIDTIVPDNLNACVPKRAPPPAVLSLSWDAPVDLDLIVVDPLGRSVGGPNVASTLDGGTPATASQASAVVDRESNANCVIDDIDRQDVVWQTPPPAGTYTVWVDLFNACKQPAVSFSVTLWLPEPRPDGGPPELVAQSPAVAQGELTAAQANGGSGPGLYVGSFVLE